MRPNNRKRRFPIVLVAYSEIEKIDSAGGVMQKEGIAVLTVASARANQMNLVPGLSQFSLLIRLLILIFFFGRHFEFGIGI